MRRYRAKCPECIDAPEGHKHCHGPCDEVKPLDEFHNATDSPDGKTARCKDCNNAACKARVDAIMEDPEKLAAHRAYKNAYNAAHVEERAAYFQVYYQTYERDPEAMAAYRVQYRLDNPEKFNTYANMRRARKTGASVCEDVDRLVVAETYDWICQWCFWPIDPNCPYLREDGTRHPGYLNADHWIPLILQGIHSYENMVPMHFLCNIKKHDWYIPNTFPPLDRIPRWEELQ